MELTESTPVFMKKKPLKKEKYRPVSVQTDISKIYEKLIQKVGYIESFLSPYLCGYRKNNNIQQALLALIEN